MKLKTTFFTIVCAFLNSLLFSQTAVPAGNVSGIWTSAGSPYHINGHILVPNGQTLTIEPGVIVKFMGVYKLFCNGQIIANGTEDQVITFTAANTNNGWLGIRYEDTPNTNGTSSFKHCKIEYGKATITGNNTGGAFNFINFSKCIIEDTEISNNSASMGGGAIKAYASSPTIKNCSFIDNKGGQGGDCVELWYCSSLIEGNTFLNSAGLYIYHSQNLNIINNHISGSTKEGAVTAFNSNINILNNVFEDNKNDNGAGGGAILLHNSIARIENNVLRNNTTAFMGGAITCFSDFATTGTVISHNLIYGNKSGASLAGMGNGGGAIACMRQSPKIINNTICKNRAANYGGALYCNYNSSPQLYNNIIFSNKANSVTENIYLEDNGSDPSFYNNNLQGGLSGIITNGNPMTGAFESNISVSPVFVDIAESNYQLANTSPCINTGMNPITGITMPGNDLTGSPRIAGSGIDLGALEYQGIMNVDEILQPKLLLYPNPATNILHLSHAIENVTIYDLTGRMVLHANIASAQIDVSKLQSGNYILKAITNGIEINQKFIKI